MFWFFGPEPCGILPPGPGIQPTSPALEGRVLTTGPPGKSPTAFEWTLVNNSLVAWISFFFFKNFLFYIGV